MRERRGEGKVTGIKEFGIGLVREYSELRTRTSDRFHQEKNKLRRDSIEVGPPSLRRSSLKEEPDNPILHCVLVPHSGQTRYHFFFDIRSSRRCSNEA